MNFFVLIFQIEQCTDPHVALSSLLFLIFIAPPLSPAFFRMIQTGWAMILWGVVIIFLVADGMVAAITAFGSLTGISSFVLSMIVVPLASNMSELIGTYLLAGQRRRDTLTQLYSMLYGGVVMNNAVSLGVFLFCLIFRELEWNFAAETVTVVIIVTLMGVFGSCTVNYLTVHMIPVLILFPVSVGLVALFQLIWKPGTTSVIGC